MLQSFINSLIGSYNEKQVKEIQLILPQINKLEEEYQKLSETEIKAKFADWKTELSENPEKTDEKLIEVFAGIKNAARRLMGHQYEINEKSVTWEMIPYDVQLIGGAVLHRGKITEMKTGEGKTLVCTLPVILNALTSKGVHVVTVNDYLAERDARWMQPLYEFCGLSVGVIVAGKDHQQRQEAYNADITYGTNNEYGFDYLRDNMAQDKEKMVQRGLHFAIVDEVDSILIDEARTPLIISAPAEESTEKYNLYAKLIPHLVVDEDYNIDIKQKSTHLTEAGVKKLEGMLGVNNLFTEAGFDEIHHIENALKANVSMVKDQDYVVQNGQVIIIDEFTGRMMAGRRFSDGLHQSLEAKEKVEIQRESKTLATVTFQNYFRLYEKLGGMTGTAETEAEEFAKIYNLDVIVIPTNRGIQRIDLSDKIFKNERGKFLALLEEIKKLNERGQPVLIGTVNIDKSEVLSQFLTKSGIKHEVLNAKHHEREAEIVANAGQKGAVTIATNMAGRGTDIKLGDGVKEIGGLAILGTERHESRRIDNQLRGRAGRQGDPGFTQFFVSMTDPLMKRFGGDKLANMMERMGLPETEAIEIKMISKQIESAQKKIEGYHFDARKHVVQYDDIMNIHREKIYSRRRIFLGSKNIFDDIEEMIKALSDQIVQIHAPSPTADRTWDVIEIAETVNSIHKEEDDPMTMEELEQFTHRDELLETVQNYLLAAWDKKRESLPAEAANNISKQIILRSIDELWLEHIDSMTHLRDRVALSGYAQKDPVMEYKAEAFRMFGALLQNIRTTGISNLFRVKFSHQVKFKPNLYEDALTNVDDIIGELEDTTDFNVTSKPQPMSRQQRRAQERKT